MKVNEFISEIESISQVIGIKTVEYLHKFADHFMNLTILQAIFFVFIVTLPIYAILTWYLSIKEESFDL